MALRLPRNKAELTAESGLDQRDGRDKLLELGPGARVIAISPHFEGAIRSVGATLAEGAAAGLDVVELTVFAGVPGSRRPPGPRDRERSFTSDGAAAHRRRLDDGTACEAIGARPLWLSFRDGQYEDERGDVWGTLLPVLEDADAVLIPGPPLPDRDHRWVTERIWRERGRLPSLGLYAPHPSTHDFLGQSVTWTRNRPGPRHWWRKQKAVAAYSHRRTVVSAVEWVAYPASTGRSRETARARRPETLHELRSPAAPRVARRPAPQPPAIILGGLANAISVARALAATGVPVYALGGSRWDVVGHSRSTRGYFRPMGDAQQDGWMEWLEREAPRRSGSVLLPCEDDALELIATQRSRLLDLGYRPFPADDQLVLTMLDKRATYQVSRRIGIPSPRTVALTPGEDALRAARELSFPFGLKPARSHVFVRTVAGEKLTTVTSVTELEDALERTVAKGVEMIATDLIPGGPDALFSYYSYIDDQGEPLFHAMKRKLRQFPVQSGAASYGVTQWDDEVIHLGCRFFKEAGVRGLAEAEFKRDPRDNRLKLIECNHRFTGSNELVRIAGIDLAVLTYRRTIGAPDPPLELFRDGVYLWGPILDTRAFLAMRGRGELRTDQWLRSLAHRQHFPVFRALDPKPTLVDLSRRLKSFVVKR